MTHIHRVLLALACITAVTITTLVTLGTLDRATTPAPARNLAPLPPVPSFTPLDGRISVLRADGYAMVPDQAGALVVADVVAKGDTAWVQARVAAGEAYWLPNGTRVRLLQAESTVGRIQVMEGQHANRVGWLPINAIST